MMLEERFAFYEDELLRTIRVDTLPVTIEKTPCTPLSFSGSRCRVTARGHLVAEYFINEETRRCYLIELRRLEVCPHGVTSRQILDFYWGNVEAMSVPGKASNAELAKLEKRLREGIHSFILTVAASVAAATFCAMHATGLKYPPKSRPIDLRAWHLIRAAASCNFGMACLNLWKLSGGKQGKTRYRVKWRTGRMSETCMEFDIEEDAFEEAWDLRREDAITDVTVEKISETTETVPERLWNPMYDILKKPTGGFDGNNA